MLRIKMGWKNWPAWLRGGIIGISLFVFDVLLLLIIGAILKLRVFPVFPIPIIFAENLPSISVFLILVILIFPILVGYGLAGQITYLLGVENELFYLVATIELIIYDLIFFFVIGAIIGWIIGKIKSRKMKNDNGI